MKLTPQQRRALDKLENHFSFVRRMEKNKNDGSVTVEVQHRDDEAPDYWVVKSNGKVRLQALY